MAAKATGACSRLRRLLAALALGWAAGTAAAENWPGWRGPRGDGTSHETDLPVHWTATSNVAWKVAVPGTGHASPIVWADHVFTVTALPDTEERVLLALDRRSGRTRWQTAVLASPFERKHPLNSHASSTPRHRRYPRLHRLPGCPRSRGLRPRLRRSPRLAGPPRALRQHARLLQLAGPL
ncbi:MAG: hypothetical protein M5U12_16320 [Verrucomicrobia bacterium]|nr:hypothetical protein [Verrucomicrobiota bacterium]